MWAVPDKRLWGDNDERFGTKQLSSITHPLVSVQGEDFRCCNLTCHQTGIWLWERPCENRASLVAANFSIDMPFTNMVDCISSMLRGAEPTIYLAEKLFCFLNGAVTKNRTLAKPSCQVRRLSKLKSAWLIYLYPFVCSVAGRVLSFVEACLCYAHGCTFLALFLLPSPKHGILNRRMQSPGTWHTGKVSHAETTMFDALMALGKEESTSYLFGVWTAHVKGRIRRFR